MTLPNTPTTTFTRRSTLLAAGILGLGASLARVPSAAFAHQGEEDNPLAGTTVEALVGGVPPDVPDASLVLLRVTMEPGVIIPPHSHPGPVALYVESGTFGTEFFEGTATLTRAAVDGTPVPAEQIAAGDDVTMPAGDNLFYDGAVHTMRNDGEDDLVLLVSALFETGAPGFEFVGPGTPAP